VDSVLARKFIEQLQVTPLLAVGAGFFIAAMVLGLVLSIVSALAWRQFVSEIPEHNEKFGRSIGMPLVTIGDYRYLYGFILGKAYEQYPIGRSLTAHYRRIRTAYIVQHVFLLLAIALVAEGSAWHI